MIEIKNKKATYDYYIEDTYEAGIVLTGTEIKSIREGKANLRDSYALIKNDECFLLNMHISAYDKGNIFNHKETRTRKLLLHKKEILKIRDKIQIKGYTLIPIKLYFSGNRAKILLGIGKGKKTFDKRESIKSKDINREIAKNLKKY
jgi:SsrA-binding protein